MVDPFFKKPEIDKPDIDLDALDVDFAKRSQSSESARKLSVQSGDTSKIKDPSLNPMNKLAEQASLPETQPEIPSGFHDLDIIPPEKKPMDLPPLPDPKEKKDSFSSYEKPERGPGGGNDDFSENKKIKAYFEKLISVETNISNIKFSN